MKKIVTYVNEPNKCKYCDTNEHTAVRWKKETCETCGHVKEGMYAICLKCRNEWNIPYSRYQST